MKPGREALLALSDVARLIRTYVDRRAAEHGMTRAQWGVLIRVERQGGLRQADIAEQMDLKPMSLVPILDRLAAQGLIERRRHPGDRRANLVFATDKGRALLEEVTPLADAIAGEVLSGLGEKDIARLLGTLERLRENVKGAEEAARSLPPAGLPARERTRRPQAGDATRARVPGTVPSGRRAPQSGRSSDGG